MDESTEKRRTTSLILFKGLRAAYIAAVVWCVATLIVAFYVAKPFKGRPGTYFARDVMPIVGWISFSLFIGGAAWTSFSKQAEQSSTIKWGVWFAFASMLMTLLAVF